MQQLRTQPAGPKVFRLYSMVKDVHRQRMGERALTVYEALTYYVHPKTLTGAIPLKLLAATTRCSLTTIRRTLTALAHQGFISITPQWDDFECVPQANMYTLHRVPRPSQVPQPAVPRRQLRLVRDGSGPVPAIRYGRVASTPYGTYFPPELSSSTAQV